MAEHENSGRKRGAKAEPAAQGPVIEGEAVEIIQETPVPDAAATHHPASEAVVSAPEAVVDNQPEAPPQERSSMGKLLGAGVVGALLASGGTLGLLKSGMVTLPADEAVTSQNAQLAKTLDARLNNLPQPKPVDVAPLNAAITEAKARSEELGGRMQQLEALIAQNKAAAQSGDASANAQLSEKLSVLNQAVTDAKAARQNLDERLKKIEASDGAKLQRKLGAALAVDALRSAFERGTPFTDQMTMAAPFIEDAQALAALQVVAAKGQASAGTLVKQFEPVAKAMLAAQPVAEGGFMARLRQSLGNVISIRRKGEVLGDTPQAMVARIEQALAKADRASALQAYEALPQPMKAAGAAWATEIGAGLAAENSLKTLQGTAISQLGGQP